MKPIWRQWGMLAIRALGGRGGGVGCGVADEPARILDRGSAVCEAPIRIDDGRPAIALGSLVGLQPTLGSKGDADREWTFPGIFTFARAMSFWVVAIALSARVDLSRADQATGSGLDQGLPLYDSGFELQPTVWISRVQQPGRVLALAEQLDGRILVAGSFDHLGFPRSGLARLDANGGVEAGYAPTLRAVDGGTVTVRTMALGGEGTLLIAGNFIEVDGVPRPGVARLLADGTLDRSFDPGTGAGWSDPTRGLGAVRWIASGKGGAVYLGGSFDTFGGTPRPGLARLMASGGIDPGFVPEIEPGAFFNTGVAIPDGGVIVGGGPNRAVGNELARLSSTGILDRSYTRNAVVEGSLGAGPAVRALAVDTTGRLYVGGDFSTVGGVARRRLARLQADGMVDLGFAPEGIPAGALNGGAVSWVGVDGQDRPWVAGWSGDARDEATYYFGGLELPGTAGAGTPWIVRPVRNGVTGLEGGLLLRDGRALVRGYVSRAAGDSRAPGVARVLGPFAGALVQWEGVSQPIPETGGIATLRLRRIGRLEAPVSVRVLTRDREASGNADYTTLDIEMRFEAGEHVKELKVRALTDALREGMERFEVHLVTTTSGSIPVVIGVGTSEVWIHDDDSGFEFDVAETLEVKEGARTVGLVVRRATDLAAPAYVGFRTVAGSARAGQDYVSVDGGRLHFEAGELSKVLTIELVDDAVAEPREEFGVELFEASPGSSVGATNTRRVRLVDTEMAFLFGSGAQGSGVSSSVAESQGTQTEIVTRIGDTSRPGSVRVKTRSGGTAVAGQDYVELDRVLEFDAGVTTRPVSLRLLDNQRLDVDASRSVMLVLSEPSEGAMLGAESEREVVIYDDESGFFIEDLTFTFSTVVAETGGERAVTVRRGFDAPSPVSVRVEAIGETAQAGVDFLLLTTNRIVFQPGQMTNTVRVAILDDAIAELDEAIRVRLIEPDPGTRLLPTVDYRIVIQDDEPTFSLRVPSSARESQRTIVAEVVRSRGVDRPANVRVATGNLTARAGQDYVQLNTFLHFAPGEAARTVVIELFDDAEVEGREQFSVGLFDPSVGAGLVTPHGALVAIDDDEPILLLTAPQRVLESDAAAFVTIHRQGAADREVRIDLVAVDNSARADVDFTGLPLSVVLTAGETNRTIAVQLVNDALPELTEHFQLLLQDPGPGVGVAQPSSGVWIQIDDDDAPEAVVGFESPRYEVGEFEGFARVWLTRSAGWGTGQVEVHVDSMTAQVGADITGGNLHLVTFWPGVMRVPLEIPVVQDALAEAEEEFRLHLRLDPAAPDYLRQSNLRIGAVDTALIRIRNQTQAIEFVETELRLPENGAPASLTVRRSGDVSAPASVRYRLVAGTAEAEADFVSDEGVIDFPAGTVRASIPIRLRDDHQAEGPEMFEVALDSPSPGATFGSKAVCALTIEDDERALSEDPTFDAHWHQEVGFDLSIVGLDVTPEGMALVSGVQYGFTGSASKVLARVLADGRPDPGFAPGAAGWGGDVDLRALQVLDDGRTLVAVQALRPGTPRFVARIVRVNRDGLIDSTFTSGVEFATPDRSAWVNALLVQPDGRILVGGDFTEAGGLPRRGIARLLPNGDMDIGFDIGAGPAWLTEAVVGGMGEYPAVRVLGMASDGRVYVGGEFQLFAGQPRHGLARLHADGRLDPNFTPDSLGDNMGPLAPYGSMIVAGVHVQADGKVVIAGVGVRTGQVQRPGIVRLDASGRVDSTFNAGLPEGSVGLHIGPATGGRLWAVWHQPSANESGMRLGFLESEGSRVTTYFDSEPVLGIGPIAALPDGRLLAVVARQHPLYGAHPTLVRFDPENRDRLTIGLGADRHIMAESGEALAFDLVRGGNSDRPVEVTWSLRGGTALEGVDFARRSGRALLAAGQNRLRIELDTILDDGLVEGGEEFEVVIEEATGGALIWPRATATVQIKDDETTAGLDLRFLPGFDGRVDAALPLAQGGLMVSGDFLRSAAKTPVGLLQALADGSVDFTFDPKLAMQTDWDCCVQVRAVAQDAQGGWVVLGRFLKVQGQDRASLVKLKPDGTVDAGFYVHPSTEWSWAQMLAVQPDGRVVLAGWGARLERLLADGRPDPSLRLPYGTGSIDRLWPQPDGQLLVGGWFASPSGVSRGPVTRFRADGTLDESFGVPSGIGSVGIRYREAVAMLQDGAVILTAHSLGSPASLLKLRPDGLLDARFSSILTTPNLSGVGLVMQEDADGGLWVAGVGPQDSADAETGWLTRRLASGAPDPEFPPVRLTIAHGRSTDLSRAVRLASAGPGAVYVYSVSQVGGIAVGPVARVSRHGAAQSTVGFATGSTSAVESDGYLELEIVRQGDVSAPVAVRVGATPGGTAVPGRDFDPSPASVRFAAMESRKTIRVPIHDNTDIAPDRTIQFELSGDTTGAVLGRSSVVASVLDDDSRGAMDLEFDPGLRLAGNYPWPMHVWLIETATGGTMDVWGNFHYVGRNPVSGYARFNVEGEPVDSATYLNRSWPHYPTDADTGPPGRRYEVREGALVRVLKGGSLDPSFKVPIGGGTVAALAPAPDGRLVVAGSFSSVAGVPLSGVARLLPDGRVDATFQIGRGLRGAFSNPPNVRGLHVQADGSILLAGDIAMVDGSGVPGLLRLLPSGVLDTTYPQGLGYLIANGSVSALAVAADGSAFVAGWFPGFGRTPVPRLVKIKPDGTLDRVLPIGSGPLVTYPFTDGRSSGSINSLAIAVDGSLWMAGSFTEFAELPVPGLVRLRAEAPVIHTAILGPSRDGRIRFRVTSPVGVPLRVESSVDLIQWNEEQSFTTLAPWSDIESSLDAPVDSPRRYYRVRLNP